jgi:hypothetical protein
MNREDYKMIATVLKDFATDGRPVDDRDEIALALAKGFQELYPRFDPKKWLAQAGY